MFVWKTVADWRVFVLVILVVMMVAFLCRVLLIYSNTDSFVVYWSVSVLLDVFIDRTNTPLKLLFNIFCYRVLIHKAFFIEHLFQ